ncbi:MAG: putative bifunctional diguanylate cyclase/phosphodiesterase [Nitrospirota bacterium]
MNRTRRLDFRTRVLLTISAAALLAVLIAYASDLLRSASVLIAGFLAIAGIEWFLLGRLRRSDGSEGAATRDRRPEAADEALRKTEKRLAESQRLAHLGSWELDLVNDALWWSDEVYRIFEIDPSQFGASYDAFMEMVHPEDRELVNRGYRESVKNRTPYNLIHRLLMNDGRIKFVHECCETEYHPDGTPVRSIGTVLDVTERQQTEHALQASERRYRGLVENMHEYLADIAPDGTIRAVNRALCGATGFSESELVGMSVFALLHPDDVYAARQHYEGLLRGRTPIRQWEHRFRKKDGGFVHVATNGDPVCEQDGTVVSIAQVSFDLTARKDAEATIRRLAYYDTLTGLPNRTMLLEHLTQAIERSGSAQQPLTLAVMNIDQFKDINNTLGHDHGDLVLQQLAARVIGLLRDSDLVARLGDDQFAVLLADTDLEGALRVGEKIQASLATPFAVGTLSLTVEVSVGLALFPEHATTADALVQRAHVAMYTAKRSRSGRAVYSSDRDHFRPRRLALMSELRYAIEHDELSLFFQPRVTIRTGRVTGVEALVRWRHPQRGIIAPDEFIPLAEHSGLIKPLTQWVLAAARDQALRWRDEGYRLTVAVNLSARTLHDPALPLFIQMLLTDDPRPWLELEITESTIMADPAGALDVLTQLHDLRIPIAIDDFGTGYSSLAYLQKLPVTTIKIDKSFVKDMATNDGDVVIVRSTIDLAHNLGLVVVAEGVETADTWMRLGELGCDLAQGYHLCRPLPALELTAWLAASKWAVGEEERPTRAA